MSLGTAEYQPSGTKPLYSPRTVPRASTSLAATTTASSLSSAWLSPTQASSTTRSAVTIADHLQWDFVRHDPDLTAALALFRRVLADRAAALPLGSPRIAPVQVPPLADKTSVPWSAASLVRVARQLAHRLLKAETESSEEGDNDDNWEPTWAAPSRVWSPMPPTVEVDSGTWTDVVRLYQEAVQVAHRDVRRASARAHSAHDTPLHTLSRHDHNLILSALHRVDSAHSAPPTVWPGLGRDGAPYRAATAVAWYRRMQMHQIRLAAGTDAAAIVIYQLTTAHNDAPHVRDLLARLAAAGISDSPLDGAVAAAQLERAVHAYVVALAHGHYPVAALHDAYAHVVPNLAPAVSRSPAFLELVLVTATQHADTTIPAHDARTLVALVLDDLRGHTWSRATYHAVVRFHLALARTNPAERFLVPYWLAEMKARGVPWTTATHNLELQDRVLQIGHSPGDSDASAPASGYQPRGVARLLSWVRPTPRDTPVRPSRTAQVAAALKGVRDHLARIPAPDADSYAIAIRAHVDHAARGKAHGLYFDSIRAGLRVPTDVPLSLLSAHLAANDVDAAVHLFVTAHDHVPGFPAAFTQNGGPDPAQLAAATLPARRAHRATTTTGGGGGADVTLVSPWHVMCHAALDAKHVDLVRLMARTLSAALDATPERGDDGFSLPEVSLVTLARALDMLGRRGLVEDAARLVECAVALQNRMAAHGLVVGEDEQRAWLRYAVDAFGRGVERMGGAHARREMVAELEERVRVGRGGKERK
ncbi:hypothetical protein AMAG_07425 [Allomyces macrogynus ATCC 38327]|uniref:Uncharacterized protein n=1 Tax=Allomyces macrogynus (strain ATCC 38327) TaxID=578462 RepID=A0A0L0SIA4_ALLM3|nr:hypothetical protein AMAG_07425 [Allomyces macrogynus ATCC 38327]|eukprot:KNE62179.1 hypothetical protein AMAG_07425 [Allomyces macrogynus ATCC 38327]